MSEHDYPPNEGQEPVAQEDAEDNALTDEAIAEAIAKGADSGGEGAGDAEEIAKLKDQVLRLAAELENTRRRAERDKVDIAHYAIANFARDLLGVADNFERALKAADETGPGGEEALSGLLAGLRMTEKELLTVLEKHGVTRIFPEGEKFDPNLHQAVAQIPSDTVPAGNVVNVAQPGFKIKERVLRAAMVMVSSGASGASPDAGSSTGAHVDTQA